ncbi:FAD/NAD(P)-binding domain-containing protein [Trametes polyzona]|nr:FAD/NAD(P)-binding domain-containing protein [Trametes polyzona]
MSTESSRSNPPLQTALPINFIIIGGGIAGLACAIALRRVGHHPVVLEQRDRSNVSSDLGLRLPPNCTKVLFHWGLRSTLLQNALVSHTLKFTQYETSELLGTHVWDEGVLKETRGLFLLTTHEAVYTILYDAAVAAGIEIRYGSEVQEIGPASPTVKLASGEVLSADVLIGADGEFGVSRKLVAGDRAKGTRTGIAVYDTMFPSSHLPEDAEYLVQDNATVGALGEGRAIVGFPIHGGADFAFQWYGPDDGPEGHYGGPAVEDIYSIAKPEGETLRMAMSAVKKAVRISVRKHEVLDDWVSSEHRLALIGEAAHPFPPGTIQATAMAIEDGAVLAKLFSHLREKRQIVNFLYAFQELRQARVRHVRSQEFQTLMMKLMGGEAAAARNKLMKEKHAAGKNVLDDDGVAGKQWEEMEVIFGYDCEDQADDWWIKWGMLRERALSVDKPVEQGILDFSKLAVQVFSTTVDVASESAHAPSPVS